jgi:hypothetical protein
MFTPQEDSRFLCPKTVPFACMINLSRKFTAPYPEFKSLYLLNRTSELTICVTNGKLSLLVESFVFKVSWEVMTKFCQTPDLGQ